MISEIVLVNGVMALQQQGSDIWARVSNAVQELLLFLQSGEFIQIPGFINRI